MFQSIRIEIVKLPIGSFRVYINNHNEQRSVVNYLFCDCGSAYPKALHYSTNKYLIFINCYRFPNISEVITFANNPPGVEDFIDKILEYQLEDNSGISHSIYNILEHYNNTTEHDVDYIRRCSH